MALTTADIRNVQASFRELRAMFVNIAVTLVESGVVVNTKGHVGLRGNTGILTTTRGSALTGGADQDTYIGIIDFDDWELAAPARGIKKGDIITLHNLHYAVIRVVVAAPGDVPMFYKMQLKG